MRKAIQAKHVPEGPILEFLESCNGSATWGAGYSMPTVRDAMPPGTPDRVQLAKMAALIRRGLVHGCACGCRGDFWLSDDGAVALAEMRRSA